MSKVPLAVLMLAQLCTSSDNCLVGIASQSIIDTLGATVADVQMATMAYSLVAGAFMIAGGMLGVRFGWRRTIRCGIALAVLGEITLALSPNMFVFTWCGRVLVGLGASLITPSVLGLVPAYYQGRDRLVAFGFIAGAAAFATLAPIPFGVLLDSVGLRASFLVLVVMFAVVFAGTFLLPDAGGADASRRLDVAGVGLAALGLFLLLTGASRVSTWGVVAPLDACPFTVFGISPALPMVACGIVVLALLIRYEAGVERRHGSAVLPSAFIKTPGVRAGLLAVCVPYLYMGAQSIVMTPYIQLVGGLTATQTGMLSLLSGVPMLVFSMFIPKLLPQASPRTVVRVGYSLLVVAACVLALSLEEHGVSPLLFVAVALSGTGMGVVNSQANYAVASAVGERYAEQSGGIQGTARNIGTAMGTAVVGSVMLVSIGLLFAASASESSVGVGIAAAGTHTFMSDKGFEATLEPYDLDEGQTAYLLEANATSRRDAARASMLFSAALFACCLVTTRNITDGPAASSRANAPSAEG
jgi:MFS family permease